MFMDLTALPTQLSNTTDPHIEPSHDAMDNNIVANETLEDSNKSNIDANAIILAEVLTDKAISWRIHNCKISKKTVAKDLPLPFLYHYDSLEDTIKQTHPLTPVLLAKFNSPMTANDAAKLIGIGEALIASPWHVKIIGSLVVFSETLQLAVRLHWTNTGKDTQQIYTQNKDDALLAAFKEWQFFGRIDVLYKNPSQTLISVDEQAESDNQILTIDASADYQFLPATHALNVIAKLDSDKDNLPWFEAAILERIA